MARVVSLIKCVRSGSVTVMTMMVLLGETIFLLFCSYSFSPVSHSRLPPSPPLNLNKCFSHFYLLSLQGNLAKHVFETKILCVVGLMSAW